MKKPYLYIGAMVAILIAAVLALMPLYDSETMAAPAPSASKSAASAAPTGAPPKAAPVSVPTPKGIEITYSCRSQNNYLTYETYTTLEELWALPGGGGKCSASQSTGVPTEVEVQALVSAYGDDYKVESLDLLYGMCGMTEFGAGGSTSQELLGATLLCPNHPRAADMKATARAGVELYTKTKAEEDASRKAVAEGRQVGEGNYLLGVDVQPGTWQTVGEKVTDCYWEISDAQGNIIANNYVSTAPQLTLEIPPGPGGFTVQGCAFRQITP